MDADHLRVNICFSRGLSVNPLAIKVMEAFPFAFRRSSGMKLAHLEPR